MTWTRCLGLILLGWTILPTHGSAQTIRRAPLDSVVLTPPALADSAPVYRAALEGAPDSLLVRTASSRYYIEIPHEALPAAVELLPRVIRAGRARGWCVWDRKNSCLTRGHFAIHLGRIILHTADSASVPFSIDRVGDNPRRDISSTADEWLEWHAMEVGIWPEANYVIGAVFGIFQPPTIVLRHNPSSWQVLALLP